VIKLDKR